MTPDDSSRWLRRVCRDIGVMPVLTIEYAKHSVPLARALADGGLHVIEVTLRTDAALDSIREMSAVSGILIGAGTLLTPACAEKAKKAGAAFGVSPGSTDGLIQTCLDLDLPLLPGAATASEIMALSDLGFDFVKFFPAETNGGLAALSALASPLPHVSYCPTGGITAASAGRYLEHQNIICVGGSWIAPADTIIAEDWDRIRATAQRTRSDRPSSPSDNCSP